MEELWLYLIASSCFHWFYLEVFCYDHPVNCMSAMTIQLIVFQQGLHTFPFGCSRKTVKYWGSQTGSLFFIHPSFSFCFDQKENVLLFPISVNFLFGVFNPGKSLYDYIVVRRLITVIHLQIVIYHRWIYTSYPVS